MYISSCYHWEMTHLMQLCLPVILVWVCDETSTQFTWLEWTFCVLGAWQIVWSIKESFCALHFCWNTTDSRIFGQHHALVMWKAGDKQMMKIKVIAAVVMQVLHDSAEGLSSVLIHSCMMKVKVSMPCEFFTEGGRSTVEEYWGHMHYVQFLCKFTVHIASITQITWHR